jgi:hypothetical protein
MLADGLLEGPGRGEARVLQFFPGEQLGHVQGGTTAAMEQLQFAALWSRSSAPPQFAWA